MEGPDITFAEAVIDNGSLGTRTVRFETGRLAKQAGGAVVAYLDEDTMIMSTTSAGKTPKDQFDFFPLTVDVEERMYSVGRIPGSFFRREGRPTTDAILTCRLIDRPLRPTFKKGLRNEVQVIITVFALNPDHQYDVLAINAASASTQISGLPFSGPIGGVRVSLIDGQWVAFPNFSDIESSVFDMVVAGRVDGEHVVLVLGVQGEHRDDDLDLVAQAFLEGRAQRPVDEPAGEHGLGRGATLAAEERTGDLADRIHALFDVHGQREEVELVLGLLARGGGAQQHRVVIEVCGDGTGCLLGEPPGLEPDGAGAEAAVVDDGFGEGDLWTLHGSSNLFCASRGIVVVPGSLLMRQGGLRVGSGGRPGHRLIGAGRGA